MEVIILSHFSLLILVEESNNILLQYFHLLLSELIPVVTIGDAQA